MRQERRDGWTESGRRERLLSRFVKKIWATVDTTINDLQLYNKAKND